MRVLITGGRGQVGRALQESAPGGLECALLSRDALDITDRASVDRAVQEYRPDVIINCAAYTAVDKAEGEPERAAAINCDAVSMLCAAADATGARLVQLSTDFVFDGKASRPYATDAIPAPLSVYAATKLGGERVALNLPNSLIVRTAWVYKAGGANFVETMLRLMAERDSISVVDDQIGTPTHARSLATAIWELLDSGASGIHHFTDAGVASWYDFAVAISEEAWILGLLEKCPVISPIHSADFPQVAMRPAYSVLDKEPTWRAIGKPAMHWRQELRTMLSIKKEQGLG